KLNLRWQRSCELDTRGGEGLSDRDNGQLDFALGYKFGREIGFWDCGLGGQRVLKPQSFDYLGYAGHRKICNRFCVQQRPLEVFQRTDVWLRRPCANGNAVCRTYEACLRFGGDLSAVGQAIENGWRSGNHVERFSGIDPSDKLRAQTGREIE